MMERAQIYLEIETSAAAGERLSAVLARLAIASVLIRPPRGVEAIDIDLARALIAAAQTANAAALIAGDARLARTLRADGVHLTTADRTAFDEAREIVGGRAIVGAVAGPLRHDAMELGESGADYVAFAPATDAGDDDQFEALIERVAWWAEIFEVPCVAFGATTPDEAAALAEAGADFVVVTVPAGITPADAQALAVAYEAALAGTASEAV